MSLKLEGDGVCLTKRSEKAVALAVGDGANDGNIFASAGVGVGIRGLKGWLASASAPTASRGSASSRACSSSAGAGAPPGVLLVGYAVFMNIVVVMPVFFLGIVSGFSGQKLYYGNLHLSYNVVRSMVPIVLIGILDQDVSRQVRSGAKLFRWASAATA